MQKPEQTLVTCMEDQQTFYGFRTLFRTCVHNYRNCQEHMNMLKNIWQQVKDLLCNPTNANRLNIKFDADDPFIRYIDLFLEETSSTRRLYRMNTFLKYIINTDRNPIFKDFFLQLFISAKHPNCTENLNLNTNLTPMAERKMSNQELIKRSYSQDDIDQYRLFTPFQPLSQSNDFAEIYQKALASLKP